MGSDEGLGLIPRVLRPEDIGIIRLEEKKAGLDRVFASFSKAVDGFKVSFLE